MSCSLVEIQNQQLDSMQSQLFEPILQSKLPRFTAISASPSTLVTYDYAEFSGNPVSLRNARQKNIANNPFIIFLDYAKKTPFGSLSSCSNMPFALSFWSGFIPRNLVTWGLLYHAQ